MHGVNHEAKILHDHPNDLDPSPLRAKISLGGTIGNHLAKIIRILDPI
jgi:hypothetical protein